MITNLHWPGSSSTSAEIRQKGAAAKSDASAETRQKGAAAKSDASAETR